MAGLPDRLAGGEDLRSLRPWLNAIRDYCKALTPRGDGNAITVNTTDGGTTISAIRQQKNIGGGVSGGSSYSGPFAASLTSPTACYVAAGWVTLGLSVVRYAGGSTTVAEGNVVYIGINYSSGYALTLAAAASLPAQTEFNIYVRIASITDGAVVQEQYGNITSHGRIL